MYWPAGVPVYTHAMSCTNTCISILASVLYALRDEVIHVWLVMINDDGGGYTCIRVCVSGLPRETEDTRSFSRFIPLLLFLMQKKETNIPTKLCIMVRHINYALIFAYYILFRYYACQSCLLFFYS